MHGREGCANGIAQPDALSRALGDHAHEEHLARAAPRELQGQQCLLQPGIVRAYPGLGRVLQERNLDRALSIAERDLGRGLGLSR